MTDRVGEIPHTFYGYLLNWKPSTADRPPNSMRERVDEVFLQVDGVQKPRESLIPSWDLYSYRQKYAFDKNDQPDESGGFHHYIAVRVNLQTGNIILAMSSKDCAEKFLSEILNRYFRPNLTRVQLRVARLANIFIDAAAYSEEERSSRHLAHLDVSKIKQVGHYKLTYVSAEVLDGGADIRTALFFGDDLANAAFYRANQDSLSARQIGVRERSTLKESARLGSDGFIQFYNRSGAGLRQLEKCLYFVNDLDLYVNS